VTFVVVLLAVIVMLRNRSANSSVDSFRRHIDALSPEARRTTVDQVQSAAARNAGDEEPVEASTDDPPAAGSPTTDDREDEGGGRGT
jgi:hypothetical protein